MKNKMIHLFLTFLISPFFVAAEESQINMPLTPEQMKFVENNAPILIQPEFKNQRDNLLPFDFDGTLNPGDNAKSLTKITMQTPAVVDWDFIEVGGAISLNFLFFRPVSRGFPSNRDMDTESAVLVFKKRVVGPSIDSKVGLTTSGVVAITNAHGIPLMGCSSEELKGCLTSDFSNYDFVPYVPYWLELNSYMKTQAQGPKEKGRILEKLDGRVLILSEPHTHALTVVTDVSKLLQDINLKKTVVYYPKGIESDAELRKYFGEAEFKSYSLRDQEFSQLLMTNKDQILPKSGNDMGPQDPVQDYFGNSVKLVSGIKTEFQNEKGEVSGANPYHGWGIVETQRDGKRYEPTDYKDGARHYCVALHLVLEKSLFGFFNEDEIKQGALKVIRNGWMSRCD